MSEETQQRANWGTANGTASTFFIVGAVDCNLTSSYKLRSDSDRLSRVYRVSAFHISCFPHVWHFHRPRSRRVSVRLSDCRRCYSKMVKRRITQTTP